MKEVEFLLLSLCKCSYLYTCVIYTPSFMIYSTPFMESSMMSIVTFFCQSLLTSR